MDVNEDTTGCIVDDRWTGKESMGMKHFGSLMGKPYIHDTANDVEKVNHPVSIFL